MSGFLYRGRDRAGERRARPKSIGPMTDFSCDETDKGPPVQMHSLREFEQHLNDLKKENFSLKLRIYFLEERIQQKYEDSTEDVHKRNIELRVEVESLKRDVQEKQQQLEEALSTVETLSNQNEAELQRRLTERQQEICHMQELLETKVQLLQEEAQLARGEAEKMASLVDSESQRCLALERQMAEKMEECEHRTGPTNQDVLQEKDRLIDDLSKEKSSLSDQVQQLEGKVQDLSLTLQKKEREAEVLINAEKLRLQTDTQRLIEDQQGQLTQYETAAGQCVTELQMAQKQVRSLQAKIRESETRNQKLQVRLGAMELELRSAREEAQTQERNIHNLSDTISSKDSQVEELQRAIEQQNQMLCSLRELANRSQLQHMQVSGAESVRGQGEVLGLQASLFQAQLEVQAGQRAQRQAERTQEDLSRALQRLEKDLQVALQHRRESERHSQELQLSLESARASLQEKEEQQEQKEADSRRQQEESERSLGELRRCLSAREKLLQDYSELLEVQTDPGRQRDAVAERLRQRLRDRDQALERAVDEKFRCVEEKEEESRQLRLQLREKERDLERQRCVLANNEETITSLEVLLRGRGLELEQVGGAWREARSHYQQSNERHAHSLREKDALIGQLQTALRTRSQEAEDLRGTLLGQLQTGPKEVLEELRARLQLKERLFQELLSDRSRQTQEHQQQVQDLLDTISNRDQYIQDSAVRLGEVMQEQAGRLQELRRQLANGCSSGEESSPGGGAELLALQEELRLALRRDKEVQEESRSLTASLGNLHRSLLAKEEIIKDFQRQLSEPSQLPLVERLTLELQQLRERLVQRDAPQARGLVLGMDGQDWHPAPGDLTSCEDDANSTYADSSDEDVSKVTSGAPSSVQVPGAAGGVARGAGLEGLGLVEVKKLVQQKEAVERQLEELKAQLAKAGFSTLSQMRRAVLSLKAENGDQKIQTPQHDGQKELEGEEEEEEEEEQEEEEEELELELDVTIEEEEEEEHWGGWEEELCPPAQDRPQIRGPGQGKRRSTRPVSLDLGALLSLSSQKDDPSMRDQGTVTTAMCEKAAATVMCEKAVRLQQESRELQERLMVSEATVQAQAEQLKDYRDLLTETSVQQDSKQIQVDLQDLGYETCGRSENEAEREDTSSPEFDDLEMCTSLDCASQWWPANSTTYSKASARPAAPGEEDVSSLQRQVEELRAQLGRSQAVIQGLQSRLRSLSTSSDYGRTTPRKVNWSFQASPSVSGAEDDEGWQSSDGGPGSSTQHPDKDLQELLSRVGALEDQLRKGGKSYPGDGKASTWPGKFDTLIQAQARELSHLRQRLREGRGVCSILTQHLGDTTKAFEELLRANDIDFYMGQGFREQLAQSTALAQRVASKLSTRDQPEALDDKTELLAIRLSKELQQKDKVIESLRAKLHQQPHHQRTDTPCSSHALSETTDQSDRISFVSDEQGSTNEDLELCSDMDAASEFGQEEVQPSARTSTGGPPPGGYTAHHPSLHSSLTPTIHPSTPSSQGARSCTSCPSMHCSFPPAVDMQSQTGFSLPQSKPFPGYPLSVHTDPSCFLPHSCRGFEPSPLGGTPTAGLDGTLNASPALKAGASLLESSALWDMAYGSPSMPIGAADFSQGSSGYQSGSAHRGSELMKEHLREVRSLRQRLEESIHTNDRLRRQLEERLANSSREKGAPTNIYIQGLDSMGQLSAEIRLLKDDNLRLQRINQDGSKEVEQLRESLLLGRARLKEAELEMEKWAGQSRKLQSEAETHSQEISQLKQDRLKNQETINRLQHEVSVVQQQLAESRGQVHSLQRDLQQLQQHQQNQQDQQDQQGYQHKALLAVTGQPSGNPKPGSNSVTFDPMELHVQLEQQLTGRRDSQPRARRQLFSDSVPSPPVRDTDLFSPLQPLSPTLPPQQTGPPAQGAQTSLQGGVPDGSFADRHGRHAVGHVDDFKALRQQLLEGSDLVHKMEAALQSSGPLQQPLDPVLVRQVLSSTQTLGGVLDEAQSLLRMFWRAALPSKHDPTAQSSKQEQPLKEEVLLLRGRLAEQEEALREAMERLQSSNRTKDSMEHFIVSQLSRTQDVLKKAKTNLQVKMQVSSANSPSLLVGIS